MRTISNKPIWNWSIYSIYKITLPLIIDYIYFIKAGWIHDLLIIGPNNNIYICNVSKMPH